VDFDFSAEQYTLRDEARRFLESQCPPSHVREFIDDEGGWSRGLWKQMADLGWMGLAFPEKYGGLGRSFDDLALLLGELGRAVAPVPFLSSVLAGHAILRHGSEKQKKEWLPPIAGGERVGALAVAGGSFDAQPVRATRDGDGWVLNGSLPAVLDAPAADLFVVAARTGPRTRWMVVGDGARVTPKLGFDRTRTIGSVEFEETPAEALAKSGIEAAMRDAAAAVCAEMVGTAQQILDLSVAYSKDREQFGRPIGSFQAIKHKAAEMLADLEASRSAAFYACWAVAAEAEDADLAVAVAKSFCSEALARLAGEGVQIHGGIAFTWEHDMHLYLRRIKSDEALFGDASYHRERIARLIDL
jgi:alkylation response protein AidB-like acyl-CoA dehydrogenase